MNEGTIDGKKLLEPYDGGVKTIHCGNDSSGLEASVILSDGCTYSQIRNTNIIICDPIQQELWERNEDLDEIISAGARVISIPELLAHFISVDEETCNPIYAPDKADT